MQNVRLDFSYTDVNNFNDRFLEALGGGEKDELYDEAVGIVRFALRV